MVPRSPGVSPSHSQYRNCFEEIYPMKRIRPLCVSLIVTLTIVFSVAVQAQTSGPGAGIAESASTQPASPRVLSFTDAVAGQPDGELTVVFSIYSDRQSGSALWPEAQVVQVVQGKYTALLGSTSSTGVPSDLFSAEQARWLGVQINGTEKRSLLVSVPYAMKAVDAERFGGLLPSQFVT